MSNPPAYSNGNDPSQIRAGGWDRANREILQWLDREPGKWCLGSDLVCFERIANFWKQATMIPWRPMEFNDTLQLQKELYRAKISLCSNNSATSARSASDSSVT
jgi:hypothetical protein